MTIERKCNRGNRREEKRKNGEMRRGKREEEGGKRKIRRLSRIASRQGSRS